MNLIDEHDAPRKPTCVYTLDLVKFKTSGPVLASYSSTFTFIGQKIVLEDGSKYTSL